MHVFLVDEFEIDIGMAAVLSVLLLSNLMSVKHEVSNQSRSCNEFKACLKFILQLTTDFSFVLFF